MSDVSVIDINLSDLDHNMRVLREIVGAHCGICPIVKADAYGLGAARIAKRLAHNGAELVAVYTPDQAAELFRAAIPCRVLVLMPVREISRVDELYRGLVADRLQLTVHDHDHLHDLLAITERFGVTISVHLEVDTGMSRGGCAVDDAPDLMRRITSARRLVLAGLFTHFASAESNPEFTNAQLAKFDGLLEKCSAMIPPTCRIHAAGSFATLRHPRYHKRMVRVGLAWAGYGLEWMDGGEIIAQAQQLRPIVTWRSSIVQIKRIASGTPVGYGSGWTARRASVIGLVPVGYADGYPSGLGARDDQPKGASVGVVVDPSGVTAPVFVPVVGAVNMDQITIDLTDVVNLGRNVGVGTGVELISPDPDASNHLPNLARNARTIPHELLCRLNPRIKRIYTASVAGIERNLAADALAG
jgi:alanine racemase